MAAASLCCSIEMEPRTLSGGQLNQAREIAGGIANKFQQHDAEIIFTEGLQPMHSTKEMNDENGRQCEQIEKGVGIIERPCQCALAPPSLDESSTQNQAMMLREPYTAPF